VALVQVKPFVVMCVLPELLTRYFSWGKTTPLESNEESSSVEDDDQVMMHLQTLNSHPAASKQLIMMKWMHCGFIADEMHILIT